ncbi:MAG: aminotransferase class I/II-fold pyridoxal phosphate-dependent enzyme, partial [Bacteroidetes bacterium]|nr:aminotransferase class I/II-fold pyridoxal phosphate-dependent enzyme [Bacteroidota bacterium]
SGTCSITQKAGVAALNGGLKEVHEMRDAFLKRRGIVYDLLTQIDGLKVNLPDGAFYFFPDVSSFFGKSYDGKTLNNAEDISLYLLNTAHVSTVTGEAFGNEKCIRISYAASEDQLREACKRIAAALANLK